MSCRLDRAAAEDFLYGEARLLDEWKLEAWAELFDEDGEYLVPSNDLPESEPQENLFLIYDDRHRLSERAKRLMKKTAHAEYPRSLTRHMISNVRVEPGDDDLVRVYCNFVVYRSRGTSTDVFPGHAIYDLRIDANGGLKIRSKRAVIDSDTLRQQRRVSIIL